MHYLANGTECQGPEGVQCFLTRDAPNLIADISIEFDTLLIQEVKEYIQGITWLTSVEKLEIKNGHGIPISFRLGITAILPGYPAILTNLPIGRHVQNDSFIRLNKPLTLREFDLMDALTELSILPTILPDDPRIELIANGRLITRNGAILTSERYKLPPTAEGNQRIISILDQSTLNSRELNEVKQWMNLARNVDNWTVEMIDLLARVVEDRRLNKDLLYVLIDPIAQYPEVADAILPIAFAGLDYSDEDAIFYANFIGFAARRTGAGDLFHKYRDVYLSFFEKASPKVKYALSPVLGQLGVDPVPYINTHDNLNDRQIILTLCATNLEWTTAVIPLLNNYLSEGYADISSNSHKERDNREAIYRAYIRHGAQDFIFARMDELGERESWGLDKMLGHFDRVGDETVFCR